ncbi:NAD(+) synthase [Fonticella tunisiensis]|uniref:Glutamine-dependent NAD(+) synthetase n=1 Tax=Fonticella tunisiensis TaxID=1096341 RepID=A0A4R7KNU0_9CLOT|nr:NAD(+) synthase [Fonticella tunisiensis]TDT56522.1 NAD+ synthase (glutamine-hydrolysing) [Fonticella tunisiensis]
MFNFIKVAAACPEIKVADVEYNTSSIIDCMKKAHDEGAKLVVFPELSITGYTCGDLFFQQPLIDKGYRAIINILEAIKRLGLEDMVVAVGSPIVKNNILYNCAIIIKDDKILGVIPKSYIPNYSEFYEKRWFTEGINIKDEYVDILNYKNIPFGVDLIFSHNNIKLGFEICEDLWTPIPPSTYLALGGANIIGNLSASNEVVGKAEYRRELVKSQSGRCASAYIYSSCGVYESTTDVVFGGHMIIGENGTILKENKRFQRSSEIMTAIIDMDRINTERFKNTTFRDNVRQQSINLRTIPFEYKNLEIKNFDRKINPHPFIPAGEMERRERCEEILNIQAAGLMKRLVHTGIKKAVIGMSGGLDSTLAFLVILKAFDILGLPKENIIAITMPGFGTTKRTRSNVEVLCEEAGVSFREINITEACIQHFKDIGHSPEILDVTYENVQARERTQILMDIANKEGALLIGTGDLSELALGWCTYNGDHMSMYAVNTSIPKTLVRYLIKYAADEESSKNIKNVLYDILDTPVSPELLPSDKEGNITQKTEEIVGPYELHDFFLYYFMRQGISKEKIIFLAEKAFEGKYEREEIIRWLNIFIKRFFTQQFKRSCLPDGPKVGTVSLSPRGDWRMPSDASFNTWL